MVTSEGGLGKGRTIKHDKVQTYVMVDTDDGWRCASFQNTKTNRLFITANRLSAPNAVGSPAGSRPAAARPDQ